MIDICLHKVLPEWAHRILIDWWWWTFVNGFCNSVVLPVVLVVLVLLLLNRIGTGLGLPSLIWARGPDGGPLRLRQFAIGVGVAALIWQVVLAGYLAEEFASNYTIDRPPFCEIRVQYDCGPHDAPKPVLRAGWGLPHGQFPGRFRYLPTDLGSFWRYLGVILLGSAATGAAFYGVLVPAIEGLDAFRDPFRLPWRPTEPVRDASASGVAPRPLYSPWLPAGIAAGAVMMSLIWLALATPDPGGTSRSLRTFPDRFGRFLTDWTGGWGHQAGRQEVLGQFIELRKKLQGPGPKPELARLLTDLRSKNDPNSWIKSNEVDAETFRKTLVRTYFLGSEVRPLKASDTWIVSDEAAAREYRKTFVQSYFIEDELRSRPDPAAWLNSGNPDVAAFRKDLGRRYFDKRGEALAWYEPYYPAFGLFVLTFAVWSLYIVISSILRRRILTPAGWVLYGLHVAAFVSATFAYFIPISNQFGLLLLFAAAMLAGRSYKLRFRTLEGGDGPIKLPAAYRSMAMRERETEEDAGGRPVLVPARTGSPAATPSIYSNSIRYVREDARGRVKPPIALVCVSGGGSRAALWTMSVLKALEERFAAGGVAFPYHVRLMTGASGGMLSAAAYAASLDAPAEGTGTGFPTRVHRLSDLKGLVEGTRQDFLGPVVEQLGKSDLVSILLPFRKGYDRGWAIEDVWKQSFPRIFDRTFADLYEGERLGWRPSLIFSPMLVEDGRQLFVSNLSLRSVTRNRAPALGDDSPPDADGRHLLSREGVEFFDLFGDSARAKFEVVTAARMSASFPYVMSAGVLPTDPPRRVVDAGYYDNYGVGIAMGWLAGHLDWVRENTSGVVLIQIRDGKSLASRRREVVDDTFPPVIARGLQWATTPAEGLWQSRVASHVFRNDHLIHLMTGLLKAQNFPADFFTTATFEFARGSDVSLSWTLTAQESQWVDASLEEIHPQLKGVIDWWKVRLASRQARP